MDESHTLKLESLREQVYQHLRAQIASGRILPGAPINLNEISQRLGISKTPLRDAIIQLECEGFVTILPRRGVVVNQLTLDDIKNSLQIIGALEGAVIDAVFHQLTPAHIDTMERLNADNIVAIHEMDYDKYYHLNIAFHDVFLNLSHNQDLYRVIMPLKQRLYDFPRRSYIKEWELINCREHAQFIDYIKAGDRRGAVDIWVNSHWSFAAHETFIRRFYADAVRKIKQELADLNDSHRGAGQGVKSRIQAPQPGIR